MLWEKLNTEAQYLYISWCIFLCCYTYQQYSGRMDWRCYEKSGIKHFLIKVKSHILQLFLSNNNSPSPGLLSQPSLPYYKGQYLPNLIKRKQGSLRILSSHLRKHHKKYLFWFFGWRAILKTILLFWALIWMFNSGISYREVVAQSINPDYILQIENSEESSQWAATDSIENPQGYILQIEGTEESSQWATSDVISTDLEQTSIDIDTSNSNWKPSSKSLDHKGWSHKVIGDDTIDLSENNGKISQWLILQSSETAEGEMAEVSIPANTYFKDENWDIYEGVLQWSKIIDKEDIDIIENIEIISALEVGNPGTSLTLEDDEWNTVLATIKILLSDTLPGQEVAIYSSQDWSNWEFLQKQITTEIDWQTYVIFQTTHFTTFVVGGILTRENLNFLTGAFREAWPSTGNIIRSLFGTWSNWYITAYTKTRSWRDGSQCDLTGMQVSYLTWGTWTLPQNPAGNTIYVLASGNYITTGSITLSWCIAIVGTGNVTLYSTGQLTNGMLYLNTGDKNIIIDNVKIDGYNNWAWSTHTKNTYGIYFNITSAPYPYNFTINNSEVYNSLTDW